MYKEQQKWNPLCRCKECTGRGLGWIAHKSFDKDLVLRAYIDGFVVDTKSGEVIGLDDVSSVYAQPPDYKLSLNDCRSVDDFDQHLKHVDLRKLPPRNKALLDTMQAEADWTWRKSNKAVDCRITAPVMKTLKVLERAIKYRNILAITQADLARMLGVNPKDLMSKLKPLTDRGLVRVRTSRDEVRKGEMILTVNPRFVFRGGDWIKAQYIMRWHSDAAIGNKNNIRTTFNLTWKPEGDPACNYTPEQLELNRQGRYVQYGESVKAMRLAQMELPLQQAA